MMDDVRYGRRIIDFDKEGVRFIFPPELDDVFVKRMPAEKPAGKDPATFHPRRVFIKVKLYRTSHDRIEPILKFDPPFDIEIHYKDIDDQNAREQDREKVCAYFDETIKDWVAFTAEEHGFVPRDYDPDDPDHVRIAKRGFKGFGVARISDWPDPAMSWGP